MPVVARMWAKWPNILACHGLVYTTSLSIVPYGISFSVFKSVNGGGFRIKILPPCWQLSRTMGEKGVREEDSA